MHHLTVAAKRVQNLDLAPYDQMYAISPGELDRRLNAIPLARDGMDFRHGDTTAFRPPSWTADVVMRAVESSTDAYTPYRGNIAVRETLSGSVSALLGVDIDADRNLIITPGTQAGLFAALSAVIDEGDTVLVADPDYFFNQRIVRYLGGQVIPISVQIGAGGIARLDLAAIEASLARKPKALLFSHPNNPTGAVYDAQMIDALADVLRGSDLLVIVDQLYCRLMYGGATFQHLISRAGMAERCITLIGPSKTESMSGFRIGCAVAPAAIVDHMESALGVMSLRAPGYNQLLLSRWMHDDTDWLNERTAAHEQLRNLVVSKIGQVPGVRVIAPRGGSYAFPDISTFKTSDFDLAVQLRSELGIAVNPGYQFGRGGCGHFRMNFSQDRDGLVDALDGIVEVMSTLELR